MRKDYPYDPKHFSNVPARGHGKGTRSYGCLACKGEPSAHFGSYEKGTSAEGAWRVSVGLSVKTDRRWS